jgi:hypothetical protein
MCNAMQLRIEIPADSSPAIFEEASHMIMRGFGSPTDQSAWLMMLVDDSAIINADLCAEVIDIYTCDAEELEKIASMWSLWESAWM